MTDEEHKSGPEADFLTVSGVTLSEKRHLCRPSSRFDLPTHNILYGDDTRRRVSVQRQSSGGNPGATRHHRAWDTNRDASSDAWWCQQLVNNERVDLVSGQLIASTERAQLDHEQK